MPAGYPVRTLVLLLLLTASAVAQFRANLEGVVKDTSGAVVPDATVTLLNAETQRAQKQQSGVEGFYRFAGLAPGLYTLSGDKAGFQHVSVQNIRISAEETQGHDLTLTPGDVAQTVTVTDDAASSLQTETAEVSRSITTEEVRRLPQLGRNPYELLRLTPGIFGDASRGAGGGSISLPNTTGPGGSNNSIFQTESQVPITANGQRVSENNFEIDGVSVNSLGWGGAAVVTPNAEAVKEVHVAANTYTAEAGRNAGGQINVVSQNGTNQLHGSGVFKLNDPAFNAYNKFGGIGLPPVRVDQRYRQFAASVGGRLLKDRLFGFFSYEGLRNNSNSFTNSWVETPQYRQSLLSARPGTLAAQILGSAAETPRVVAVSSPPCPSGFAPGTCAQVTGGLDVGSFGGSKGLYTPLTGGGLDGIPDIQYAQLASPSSVAGNQYNGRLDYTHGSDSVALSMFFTKLDTVASDTPGGNRPIGDLPFSPLNTAVTLTYTRVITPSLLNEARANLTRFASNQLQAAKNANFGVPRIEIQDYAIPDRIRFGAPQGESTPAVFTQNTYEVRDNLSWIRGAHALKFGGGARFEQDNDNLLGGARPLYVFSGLFNFANDTPIFEQINASPLTGAPADAQRYFRTETYYGFAQDDWKIRPNFTLNIGLRWEYFTPLREKYDRITNLVLGPNQLQDAKLVHLNQLTRPDRNNFAPRFGFAWNPKVFGDKSVVVRGGFGMYYSRVYDNLLANSRANGPDFARYGICCGTAGTPFDGGKILYSLGSSGSPLSYPANPQLATGVDPVSGGVLNQSIEIYGAPQNFPAGYAYIYSFDLQYQLPARLVAVAGYQGSTDHKLIRLVNENFLYPNNPAFTAVYFATPDVNSNYNALLLGLNRQFANGFQFSANYRWAKSLDESSFGGPGSATNQTYPQNLRSERGPSDFDVTQNFSLSGLYDLPFYKKQTGLLGHIFGGFQLNGIVQAHTGFPWTPVSGTSVQTPGGPTLAPTRPVAYLGGAGHDYSNNAFLQGTNFPLGGPAYFDITKSGFPGISRNSFRGPRYFATDLSVAKSIRLQNRYLGEATRLDLRANLYNVFNNLNLAPFQFASNSAHIDNSLFGRAENALAGRVVEFQARLSF